MRISLPAELDVDRHLHAAQLALCDDRLTEDAYDLLEALFNLPGKTLDLSLPVFSELFDLPESLNLLVNHGFLSLEGEIYQLSKAD